MSYLVNDGLIIDPLDTQKPCIKRVSISHGDIPYFINKFPTNYLVLPPILMALPKAKIIHLWRFYIGTSFYVFTRFMSISHIYALQ